MKDGIICTVMIGALIGFSSLDGKRPAGNFGGSKQMDIAQMEKDLGQKFAVPFPSERFDIDYFYQGDLFIKKAKGEEAVVATCPFVVGPMVAFGLGKGATAESLKLTAEVNIDFGDEGEVLRCTLRSLSGDWPKVALSAHPAEGESAEAFRKRLLGKWMEAALQAKESKFAAAQVRLAMEVLTASLKQGGAQKER